MPNEKLEQVRCPFCGQRLKFKLRSGGKTRKCPTCQRTFTLPDSTIDAPTLPSLQTPVPLDTAPTTRTREENAAPPFTAPYPGMESPAPVGPPESFSELDERRFGGRRNAGDLALSSTNLLFTAQLFCLWSLPVGVSAFAVYLVPKAAFLLLAILVPWTIACYVVHVGGVSHAVAQQLDLGLPMATDAVWAFVVQRAASLVLGPLAVGVVFSLAMGALLGGVAVLSHRLPAFGSLVFLPIFAVVLIGLFFVVNAHLIPSVIGVEECSIAKATQTLLKLILHQPLYLIESLRDAAASIVPMALMSGTLVFVSVGVSAVVCGVSPTKYEAASENLAILVQSGIVFAVWLAVMSVFVTTSFTVAYYNVRRQD